MSNTSKHIFELCEAADKLGLTLEEYNEHLQEITRRTNQTAINQHEEVRPQ
jgi:hypothetical protein